MSTYYDLNSKVFLFIIKLYCENKVYQNQYEVHFIDNSFSNPKKIVNETRTTLYYTMF